ncbi:16_t:CDS:2 [Funneliformis geosporum]|uniref:5048_t:CDS:1 n=1 Tax=Funneliformis geosporum TaxID=1117311 RepID=A0A9W4SHY5_9GLOM|nr:16_t:CDS:2 [Funneliformis geosporum]CAI2170125.1 5048_t:CDS:2 [Funneliformis geosporum]
MAVPQKPVLNKNEETIQNRQNVSPKVSRARQQLKNGLSQQPQDDGYYLRISITALDKNRRDPAFKFKAITNLPRYKNSSYPSIERSYVEFERLYNALAYSNPECIVPALPFSSSSYQANEEDERKVKHSLQQWVNRVAMNPFLCHDEELRSFIETDFTFIPATKPRKRSSGFRLFSSDIRDEDKGLTQAKSIAHILEGHFLDNAKTCQKLAKYRKGLATFNSDLGIKSIALGTVEKHPPLSNGIRKFGKSLQIISELQKLQAISDVATLGDFFSYYAINSHVVKETLANRLKIISEHDEAVKTTISKRRYIERLKSSTNIKPEKVDEALKELEYSKGYEQNLDARVKRVTNNLHNELRIYEENRAQDFFNTVKEYVKKQIVFEKQQLKEWENLRPDIKAITKRNMHIHAFGNEKLDAKAVAERLSTYM